MSTERLLPTREYGIGILEAVLSSASLFLIVLGALLIAVAFVVPSDVWPAILIIWGISLAVAGGIAQALRQWNRRKSY